LTGTVVESTSCLSETAVNVASPNFDDLDHTVLTARTCLLNEISSEDIKIPDEKNVASKNVPSTAYSSLLIEISSEEVVNSPEESNVAAKNVSSLNHSSLTSSTTGTFSAERISLKSVISNPKKCCVVLEDIGPFLKNQRRISYKLFMERTKQKRGLQSILKKKRSKRFKRILWTSDEESDSETGTVNVPSRSNPSKRSKRLCLPEDNDREPFPGPSWWTEDTKFHRTTKQASNVARQFGSNAKADGISKYRKKYTDGSRMRSQAKRLAEILIIKQFG
jgi:hypothetical protein